MRKVKVITESTADLSKEITDSRAIEVIPLHILLGEKSCPDDGSFKNEDLFEFIEKTDTLPNTVPVTQNQFEEVFKKWLREDYDIFFTGMSKGINSNQSETTQGAVAAARAVTTAAKLDRERISVVDSLSLSCGTGLLALEAADMADSGLGLKEITEHALTLRPKVQASLVIDTLKYFYMGGMISKLSSAIGNGLNIKPKLELKAGEIAAGANFTGKDYIYKYCEQVMKDAKRIDPKRIIIAHCLTESAGEVREKLGKDFGFENVIVTNTSLTTSIQCGPGTLGIFFLYK